MAFNSDRHERRSVRLKDYNYAQAGVYFVTICTRNRVPYMAEPPVHAIVDDTWKGIPDHAVGVTLD
jgi:hypothetical protein